MSLQGFSNNNGDVICTSTNELENLANDLRKIETLLYDAEWHKNYKLTMGRKDNHSHFHLHIGQVGKDDIARCWLVNWFCEHGWEPFSHFEGTYSFRRVREQD